MQDDAISREAVEQMIKAEMPERGAWEIGGNKGDVEKQTVCEVCVDLLQSLNELPSVTHKSGKWLKSLDYIGDVKCSICSKEYDQDVLYDAKYCPNCGARMESEDKE